MVVNNIIPNWEGFLLLLFLSIIFSSINFFTELPDRNKFNKTVVYYLVLWAMVNYIFALILLILILPPDIELGRISKGLFIYCLVATALPELSANLRLQIGQSSSGMLDLHKYKARVSQMITKRLERNAFEYQNRLLKNLLNFYTGRMPEFLKTMKTCSINCDLTDNDKRALDSIIREIEESADGEDLLMNVLSRNSGPLPIILEMFKKEIEYFENSTVSILMSRLHPLITVIEARKLVNNNIKSVKKFIVSTVFGFQRRRLSRILNIPEDRIMEIRNVTLSEKRRAFNSRFKWAFAVLLIFGFASLFVNALVYTKEYEDKNYEMTFDNAKRLKRTAKFDQDSAFPNNNSKIIIGTKIPLKETIEAKK